MFTALLDTSVLWPSLQRDFLLSVAAEGLYRPTWSRAILRELAWAEEDKRNRRGASPDEARDAATWLVQQMSQAFDDSCIEGWEPLVGSYGLPDPDDEHLVAAAAVGGANIIVSSNLKHLPAYLLPAGIEAVAPAVFAAHIVSIAPRIALSAITKIAARYENPPRSVDDLAEILVTRYAMDEAVELIKAAQGKEGDDARG